jgi:hypothetical protein
MDAFICVVFQKQLSYILLDLCFKQFIHCFETCTKSTGYACAVGGVVTTSPKKPTAHRTGGGAVGARAAAMAPRRRNFFFC